jgi:hypothetical protein
VDRDRMEMPDSSLRSRERGNEGESEVLASRS